MNKLTSSLLIALILVVMLSTGAVAYKLQPQFGGGSAINVSYYKTATNTSVVCSGTTSTLILAAATRPDTRNSFEITVASSSITFCKSSSGCLIGQGLTLNGSTTQNISNRFAQTDAYYGPYSCIGNNGVSSTIGVIYNQS